MVERRSASAAPRVQVCAATAHGIKGDPEIVHHGTATEAFHAAHSWVLAGFREMIDTWRR
jgi:hypothetical protein